MTIKLSKPAQELVGTLCLSSIVSLGLLSARIVGSQSLRYSFLVWNLLLAWLPLALAWWFVTHLKTQSLKHWSSIALLLLWLGFLPNSFYVISDFIHLHTTGEVSLLYDVVLMTSFVFNGLALGFMSLYLVHKELLKRFKNAHVHLVIALVLLICSFAIYLGRYLRWNTWDVLVRPAGLLFDVSDHLINPAAHPKTLTTTLTFFALLGSMYLVIWRLGQAFHKSNR